MFNLIDLIARNELVIIAVTALGWMLLFLGLVDISGEDEAKVAEAKKKQYSLMGGFILAMGILLCTLSSYTWYSRILKAPRPLHVQEKAKKKKFPYAL
mmetsp:Transcript_24391/g.58083  ORF Transcript_24391/g.58083 Transcript_24391/m.58083 type:complete len:98 (-) Transcript_24391:74-367(-)